MTPLEKLKEAHLENWMGTGICEMTAAQQAWLDLAPTLIALWEAVEHDYAVFGLHTDGKALHAFKTLNAKAAQVLHE